MSTKSVQLLVLSDLRRYSLIDDDNFTHALRIYRDRISGAIRLQASVHEGDMKRYFVWYRLLHLSFC